MPTIQLQVPQLIMRTITKHYTVNHIRQNKTIYNGLLISSGSKIIATFSGSGDGNSFLGI